MLTRKSAFGASLIALALAAVVPAHAQKAAMLLPGSINDQSWNAQGFAGLTKLKDGGFEIAYSENVPAADHVEAMRDYARRGFNIIIGHSGRFLSALSASGPNSLASNSWLARVLVARAAT